MARVRRRRRAQALVAAREGDLRRAAGHLEALLTEPLAPHLLALSARVRWSDQPRRSRLGMAVGRAAAARHVGAAWPGPAMLVWSRPRADGRRRWGDLLSGAVEEVTVGGDHTSMLYRPQVDDLAAALLAALAPERSGHGAGAAEPVGAGGSRGGG